MRYLCEQCEYVATTHSSLKRHKECKRERIRYPCDYCEYAATRYDDLKRHKKTRHFADTVVSMGGHNVMIKKLEMAEFTGKT